MRKDFDFNTGDYFISFENLTDLYDYIKSSPPVNRRVFDIMASQSSDMKFYGESLDKCIEWCFGGYDKGLDNFLMNSVKLKETIVEISDDRRYIRGLYGGVPIPSLVAANVPDSMARYEIDKTLVTRTIYFSLPYSWVHNPSQIINRGLATLFIIQALEEKGQIIDFKAIDVLRNGYETVKIDVDLKKPGDLYLDVRKCYFPLVAREFLRRVMFRVLESIPVTDIRWGIGYGTVLSYEQLRLVLGLRDDDLLIPDPNSMYIEGYNIYDDTIAMISFLGLEDEFDIDKIKSYKYKQSGYSYRR